MTGVLQTRFIAFGASKAPNGWRVSRALHPRIAFCLLFIACCLLPTAYCLLPTAYCLLPAAFCLLLHGAEG